MMTALFREYPKFCACCGRRFAAGPHAPSQNPETMRLFHAGATIVCECGFTFRKNCIPLHQPTQCFGNPLPDLANEPAADVTIGGLDV